MKNKPLAIRNSPSARRKVLVTGGAGFIGSHLADALVARGDDVFVIDNLSSGLKENVNPKAKLFELDIGSPETADLISREKPEAVFHLAAHIDVRRSVENPMVDAQTNILGTLNLLKAASDAGVKKFIFSSTGGAIYGEAGVIPTPETYKPQPLAPYGLAKLTVERYLDLWHKLFGLNYVVLRYANVYGPRQALKGEAGVVAIFIRKLLAGEDLSIFGDGDQTRDLIYVADVVDANLKAAEFDGRGVFNIATGKETSINALLGEILDIMGKTAKKSYLPPNPGEVLRSGLDASLAKKTLGWKARVGLEEGLRKTVDFFKLYAEESR